MSMLSAQELEDIIGQATTNLPLLNQLLSHYRPFLRLIAEQSLGPAVKRREDASDIVQQTLAEAAAGIGRFSGHTELEFTAWVRQILKRNVINAMRDHRAAKRDVRQETYLDGEADGSASISWHVPTSGSTSPSLKLIKAESALNLATAMEKLPADQCTAVTLRHLSGLSLAEMAVAMNKTPAAVAGLLRRGISQLRIELNTDLPGSFS